MELFQKCYELWRKNKFSKNSIKKILE